ncbi:hypothetical protein D3C76_1761090 [compost metagenome]
MPETNNNPFTIMKFAYLAAGSLALGRTIPNVAILLATVCSVMFNHLAHLIWKNYTTLSEKEQPFVLDWSPVL